MIHELLSVALDPVAPPNLQASKQALEILQRVQAKVLLEMWTTIMLCVGMLAVALSQLCTLFGFRRIAAVWIMLFGFAMTWVPAGIAPPIGYATIVLGLSTIVKDFMSGRDEIVAPAAAAKRS